jgi:hypothetical protein
VRNTIVNTVLSTPVDEQNHTHPPSWANFQSHSRTVSIADRAALHVGLALITWSRRPRTVARSTSREELRTRRAAAFARASREAEWQLALYLSQVRR